MNKQFKESIKIINEIQKVRSKNNKNWMDLVRLSLKLDFKKTSKILYHITNQDKKISGLSKKIYALSKINIKK
tara:strand:+ start:1288 stop:1506 length:219 start_codon:yes stop_codon:yes gene_type:complete